MELPRDSRVADKPLMTVPEYSKEVLDLKKVGDLLVFISERDAGLMKRSKVDVE